MAKRQKTFREIEMEKLDKINKSRGPMIPEYKRKQMEREEKEKQSNTQQKDGVWRTVRGRHVFIEEGKTLEQALGHKPGVENQKKINDIKPDYLPGKRSTEELKGMRFNTLTDEEKEQLGYVKDLKKGYGYTKKKSAYERDMELRRKSYRYPNGKVPE